MFSFSSACTFLTLHGINFSSRKTPERTCVSSARADLKWENFALFNYLRNWWRLFKQSYFPTEVCFVILVGFCLVLIFSTYFNVLTPGNSSFLPIHHGLIPVGGVEILFVEKHFLRICSADIS